MEAGKFLEIIVLAVIPESDTTSRAAFVYQRCRATKLNRSRTTSVRVHMHVHMHVRKSWIARKR